ncbi:MAG: tetratricopeptide repeat protein [Gammaproteobacteria bacterium]|nr:tetratricopeptide repeat protein [Gammaproteobacteria bacterium]
MPAPAFKPTLCLLALLCGCQSVPPDAAGTAPDEAPQPLAATQLRAAFLAGDELPQRMDRLIELESEAIKLMEYEPLKLGAIGSAILDLNPGSLVGHRVLQRFYGHVDAADTADGHRAWAEAVKASMSAGATGAVDAPFRAVTPIEAQIFLRSEGLSPVGAIYQSTAAAPLLMMVQGRPERGPLRALHFTLEGIYRAAERGFAEASGDAAFSPLALMGLLARQGDPAAQTAVGALLIGRNRTEDAIGWLQAGSRFDNVIANNMLALIHWTLAQADPGDERQAALNESLDNYLQAIALGSSEAMYALGALYLRGAFGGDNAETAIPLLKQAAELDNSDALHYLAHLHYAGNKVAKDRKQAEDYFVRAAALDNEAARLSYARYLMRERRAGDSRTVAWLEETVEETANPEAMLMLGNLHARGVATEQNLRIAQRWYRNAAKAAGADNAQIVNEVAWTLAVSDLTRLRRGRFANRIMTRMMESNDQARSQPEYLDTWAATYAATGNFPEAVRLQEMAVQEAVQADRDDVLDILQQHLDLFLNGKPVIEQVP